MLFRGVFSFKMHCNSTLPSLLKVKTQTQGGKETDDVSHHRYCMETC